MTELFTEAQIATLHAEFGTISTIDPCSPSYDKLIATLDAMDEPQLRQVHQARIKFLSRLALNRLPKEG